MKRILLTLLFLVPLISMADTRENAVRTVCSNTPVYVHVESVDYADSGSDDKTSAFGSSSHRGVTKSFKDDPIVAEIIECAVKDAFNKVERAVVVLERPENGEQEDGNIHVAVRCRIKSVTSTVEERRDGVSWGGVWGSVKMHITVKDINDGHVYFSDNIVSEGRSSGGFNINISSVEDAAARMSCFLAEDLREVFPIAGMVAGQYTGKTPKSSLVISLGSDDNVYPGGMSTYRVSKIVPTEDSFKLVEIGSGYIYDVISEKSSIFRISVGEKAVMEALSAGETLIVRAK